MKLNLMKECVLLGNLRLTLLISSAKSCWSLCFEGLRLRTIRRSTLLSMKTRLERWRLYTLALGLDWMRFKLMFFEEIIFSIFWASLIINWSLEEKNSLNHLPQDYLWKNGHSADSAFVLGVQRWLSSFMTWWSFLLVCSSFEVVDLRDRSGFVQKVIDHPDVNQND